MIIPSLSIYLEQGQLQDQLYGSSNLGNLWILKDCLLFGYGPDNLKFVDYIWKLMHQNWNLLMLSFLPPAKPAGQ